MDLHAAGIVYYFEGDTVAMELYAEPKILEAIQNLRLVSPCLASTDMGRAKWVEVRSPTGCMLPWRLHPQEADFPSSQTQGIAAVVGDVCDRDVVIFDDMIRTGGSLLQAAEAYLKAGAKSVHAVATHLVLPPGTVERLESSPLAKIIGTDTHPNHQLVSGRPKFEVVSVAGLFAEVVARLVS